MTRTYSYLDHPEPLFLGASGTFVVVGLDLRQSTPEALVARLRAATEPVIARVRPRLPEARARWTGEVPLNVDLRQASALDVRSSERRALPLTLVLLVLAFGSVARPLLSLSCGAIAIVAGPRRGRGRHRLGAALGHAGERRLHARPRPRHRLRASDGEPVPRGQRRGAERGGRAEEAARHAGATVLVSGTAVAIGFVGLLLVPLAEVRSIAVGGLLVTVAAVLLATTLLPALLAEARPPASMPAACVGPPVRGEPERAWRRWGTWVAAHPMLVLLVGGRSPPRLAVAAQRMQTGLPEDDWLPARMDSARGDPRPAGDGEGRRGADDPRRARAARGGLRPQPRGLGGDAAPRRLRCARTRAWRRSVRSAISRGSRPTTWRFVSFLPGFLKHAFVSSEGDAVLLEVVPREDVEPDAASGLVRDLRRMDAARADRPRRSARCAVGGLPAFNADYADALARAWPSVLAVVLLGSLLVLFAGFRSLLVPLKAVGLNLLSVAAALGAVVLVFQDGRAAWLGLAGAARARLPGGAPARLRHRLRPEPRLRGVPGGAGPGSAAGGSRRGRGAGRRPGPDRRRHHERGRDHGGRLRRLHPGATIACVKMLGFALATAVLLDATLVRVAVGPALLRLVGRWNWWPGMGGPDPPPAV